MVSLQNLVKSLKKKIEAGIRECKIMKSIDDSDLLTNNDPYWRDLKEEVYEILGEIKDNSPYLSVNPEDLAYLTRSALHDYGIIWFSWDEELFRDNHSCCRILASVINYDMNDDESLLDKNQISMEEVYRKYYTPVIDRVIREIYNIDGPTQEEFDDMDRRGIGTEYINNKNNIKQEDSEMSMDGMFNGMFGHVPNGTCRLGLNGALAVKTSNGYKTYDVDTGRLTNVTQFCFDIGQELFFIMPTTKAKKGDILLIDNKPKCVIENKDNKIIKVMDYENSALQEIVPERHVFMGQTYLYRKIVSMFGSGSFLKGEKGMGKMMKLMLMKEMFKGFGGGSSGDSNGMMSMLMMSQMFNGSGSDTNMLGEMFDLDMSLEDPETEEDEESIEELEAKLAKLKEKKAKENK